MFYYLPQGSISEQSDRRGHHLGLVSPSSPVVRSSTSDRHCQTRRPSVLELVELPVLKMFGPEREEEDDARSLMNCGLPLGDIWTPCGGTHGGKVRAEAWYEKVSS